MDFLRNCAGKPASHNIFFAFDSTRTLLMGMSPAPPTAPDNQTPVIQVLGQFLKQIEVVREPIHTLFPLVDHRYDRLMTEE